MINLFPSKNGKFNPIRFSTFKSIESFLTSLSKSRWKNSSFKIFRIGIKFLMKSTTSTSAILLTSNGFRFGNPMHLFSMELE